MKYALILEDMPESQELLQEVAQAAFPGIECHCAEHVAQAMDLLRAGTAYDLGLIDLALPDGDGAQVVQALARRLPGCMIVVATIFDDDSHLFPALRAGAQGYLLKDEPAELLIRQLHGILEGEPPLSPSVARRLLAHFRAASPPASETPSVHLTSREQEVLTHLARGTSIATIGQELGISRHTAGDHVKNIYRKLNISSRAQAALEAKQRGLLTDDPGR